MLFYVSFENLTRFQLTRALVVEQSEYVVMLVLLFSQEYIAMLYEIIFLVIF